MQSHLQRKKKFISESILRSVKYPVRHGEKLDKLANEESDPFIRCP